VTPDPPDASPPSPATDRWVVQPGRPLVGELRVPGDKSISHRALLFGSLTTGSCQVTGFLPGGDCLATLGCVRGLGIRVDQLGATEVVVHGRGLGGLQAPTEPLDCVRSGTTMRLLAGLLAGQPFASTLVAAPQLARRPMARVAAPLALLGAQVTTTDGRPPLQITGTPLHGAEVTLPVASAQLKSAVLLAGLFATGETIVHEPGPSRDHSERLLAALGADLAVQGPTVRLRPGGSLRPFSLAVPGDPSSAAFPLVAALLVPGSRLAVTGVGINPTRTGLFDVLQRMGARLTIVPTGEQGGEPVGTLWAEPGGSLRGVEVGGETVVRAIDELPLLAVAACHAVGVTVLRDAAELRVKETDRIETIVTELRRLGAAITACPDGFVVHGPCPLQGGTVTSHGDHRLAMALTVAGLGAAGPVTVEGTACVGDSFPGFFSALAAVGALEGDCRS